MCHDKAELSERSNGVMECWSNVSSLLLHYSNPPSLHRLRRSRAFALYEVLIGVTVFVIGVLALGHSVQNCLTASTLTAEDSRVRLVLANRMAEVQATPGVPDSAKENKVDTGYGEVKLIQKTAPAQLTEEDGVELTGVSLVTLTAQWDRGGVTQSQSIQFYVYRPG
jgi:Tfp pilus assembly protein PilV